MSTVVVVHCDGCETPVGSTWVRIEAIGGFADQQMYGALSGSHRAAKLSLRLASGLTTIVDRLDYCSAECAAKHLASVPTP